MNDEKMILPDGFDEKEDNLKIVNKYATKWSIE